MVVERSVYFFLRWCVFYMNKDNKSHVVQEAKRFFVMRMDSQEEGLPRTDIHRWQQIIVNYVKSIVSACLDLSKHNNIGVFVSIC